MPLRIAFFIFGYPLGISEVIIQSILGFAAAGCRVDVYIDEAAFDRSPIAFDHDNVYLQRIELKDLPEEVIPNNLEALPSLRIFLRDNTSFPRYPLFIKQVLRPSRTRQYNCVFGVEPFGLIAATICRPNNSCRVLYFNLELYDRGDCTTPDAHRLKDLEIEAARHCFFTILPDRRRARHFVCSTGASVETTRLLTVSTSGRPLKNASGYFRDKFKIEARKKIILYAGHFAEWACCREIVAASTDWPVSYVLLMHTWRKDMAEDSYLRELKSIAGNNVIFSLDPISHAEYPAAVSSADIGLLFYDPVDANFRETGSSSNKLAVYLRAGLPVIASDASSIRVIFNRYQCGRTVTGPGDIVSVLPAVFADYDRFQTNAHRAYRRHYNFEHNFAPIRDELLRVMSATGPNSTD